MIDFEKFNLRGLIIRLRSSLCPDLFPREPKYLIGSALIFSSFYLSVHIRDRMNIVVFATLLFAISASIMVSSLYGVTMRMTHRNSVFYQDGWFYRFLTHRTLAVVFWFSWGLITSYSLFIRMSFFSGSEWLLFLSMFPCFWVTLHFVQLGIKDKVEDLYKYRFLLGSTNVIFPTSFAAIYAVTSLYGDAAPVQATLAETIRSATLDFDADTKSAFMKDSLFIFNAMNAPQKWILGNLPGAPSIAIWILDVIAIWVLAFNLSNLLAILVLPSLEIKRVISPISNSATPREVEFSKVVYWSACTTVFFLFIYLRGFIALEVGAATNPTYAAVRAQISSIYRVSVEMIDGRRYEEGTIEKIQQSLNGLLADNASLVAPLHDMTNTAFDQADGKVDEFLDWYYELGSEYTRLGSFAFGNAESYLKSEFQSRIIESKEFDQLNVYKDNVISQNAELARRFEDSKALILMESLLSDTDLSQSESEIVITASLSDFDLASAGLDSNLGARGAASAFSGLLAGKITAKLATKAGFKVATMSLSKIAIGGVGSAASAMAAGSAVGSVVPGLGTAIGAGLGLAFGIGIDFLVLKYEERENRDQFRADILITLCESRVELLQSLRAPSNKFPEHCSLQALPKLSSD